MIVVGGFSEIEALPTDVSICRVKLLCVEIMQSIIMQPLSNIIEKLKVESTV